MSGALLGLAVFALLAGTGLLLAIALRLQSTGELILAAWLLACAEVVVVALVLSLFDSLTRTALALSCLVALALAAGAWLRAGRPRPPFQAALGVVTKPRPLLVLAVAVAVALSYVFALIVGTPPNGWDPLNYHLARAAFWLQSGRIGYIDGAYDERLNFNPPNAEIVLAFGLGVVRHEAVAGFVQFFAALACATGVFALARRIGLRRSEAAFGALLFLTLPIVVLQSSGTKNDLVVAAFLMAAAVFVHGDSRRELALAALATALAVGTKFTAAYGLALLLLLALAARPRRLRRGRLVSLAVGALAGAYWYGVNAAETGHALGDQTNIAPLTAPFELRENLVTAYGVLVDTLDLSGATGADLLLYVLGAIVVAIVLARGHWRTAALGAAIALSPLVLFVLSKEVGRPSLLELHDAVGASKAYLAVGDDVSSSATTASDTASWFGPAGLLLVLGVGIAAVLLVRRRLLPRVSVVLALAPLIWLALVAFSLTYHPWQGRFFIFPVALSAGLWGLTLRAPAAAWGAVAVAVTTLLLALVHYVEKPSGIRLLDGTRPRAVWTQHRWEVQAQHDPALAPLLRFLAEEVPRRDSVALALGTNSFGYPVFGPRLERDVELVPFGSDARDVRSDWLVAIPQRESELDVSCQRVVFRSERGTILRRVPECVRP